MRRRRASERRWTPCEKQDRSGIRSTAPRLKAREGASCARHDRSTTANVVRNGQAKTPAIPESRSLGRQARSRRRGSATWLRRRGNCSDVLFSGRSGSAAMLIVSQSLSSEAAGGVEAKIWNGRLGPLAMGRFPTAPSILSFGMATLRRFETSLKRLKCAQTAVIRRRRGSGSSRPHSGRPSSRPGLTVSRGPSSESNRVRERR
jgi:hypothetical protein